LFSGCFVVVKDGEKVKVFGEGKETALDTLKKTEEIAPKEKREIRWFAK
jgi:hypothetical protein